MSTFRDCFGTVGDTSLADAIAGALAKLPTATFTSADQATTSLSLQDKKIKSLEGIGNLPNLASLDLGSNLISDVSPLAALRGTLQKVWLDHNRITDLTPIDPYNNSYPKLKWLDATGQLISVPAPAPNATTVTLGPVTLDYANNHFTGADTGWLISYMPSPGARDPSTHPAPTGGTWQTGNRNGNRSGAYTWPTGGTHTYGWTYINSTSAGGNYTFAFTGTIVNKPVCRPGVNTIAECFPDTNMANAMAQALGKTTNDLVTPTMQQNTTSLDLGNKNIENVEGIQTFYNLQKVWLDHNRITDLTPIDPYNNSYPKLKWLDATGQLIPALPAPNATTVTLGPVTLDCNNSHYTGADTYGSASDMSPGPRDPSIHPTPTGGTWQTGNRNGNRSGAYTWPTGGTHTYGWNFIHHTRAGGYWTFAFTGEITYSGYRVTFDPQNGQAPTHVWLENFNLPVAKPGTDPLKPGYSFTGWYTQPTGGNKWNFSTIIQDNITLYAHYQGNPLPMTGGTPNQVPTIIALAALGLAGVTICTRRMMDRNRPYGSTRPSRSW
ncbi:hypothetical protein CRD60_05680 [Bifidobacterium aemilianum]|uniref:Gram-positive cocci surface proteins LPxTG domain-containing protein n=1 Tax=Bifidobacterium aemilianum TaxID=2493120 RepID=A0A366KAM5_9BIFI|nr:leucine-rich repeat domain-containing protein [Bifidobacterium aemilianum]RBP97721.1 hypothetical protein CRD60_05680 [Bifidobacterium aemilianum]